MQFLFIFFTIIAALLTILLIGLIVLSVLSGGGNVLIPSFGLVVSLPLVIILLAIIDVALIALALLFRSISKKK